MNDIIKDFKVFWSIGLIFSLAIFGSKLAFTQNRTVGGLITIGEINNPGNRWDKYIDQGQLII